MFDGEPALMSITICCSELCEHECFTVAPVAFFALPGRPTRPTVDDARFLTLVEPGEDPTAALIALAEAVDGPAELIELVASRSGRLGDWDLVAALKGRRERFQDAATGADVSYSTLVYPSLWAKWGEADDPLYPRRARGVTLELSGGHSSFGSDIDFLQLRAEGRWVRQLGRRNRVLLRAEAGTTISDEFPSFPPSLRFYAGGDRSVRGYGYQEIGQYFEDADGRRFVFGGKHLMVVSAEVERMFNRTWGMAVFVDAGDAFDSRASFDWEIGAGLGLRWRVQGDAGGKIGSVWPDTASGATGQSRTVLDQGAPEIVNLEMKIAPWGDIRRVYWMPGHDSSQ